MSDDEMIQEVKGRKILVAMDGSVSSTRAFEWYVKHVFRSSDRIIIAYCAEKGRRLRANSWHGSQSGTMDQHDADVKRVFREIEEVANKYRIRHILERLYPPVGAALVSAATSHNADLIIVGSRGEGVSKHPLLETTSTYVAHHSPITVLVCTVEEDER